MASITLSRDYYKLEVVNTIVSGYQKNGAMDCGKNTRDPVNGFVSEVLVKPELSLIPSGSTIDTVTVTVNTTSHANLNPASSNLGVRLQDKGAWTDTPTTSPIYSTFPNVAWVSPLLSESADIFPASPAGAIPIPTNPAMVLMFQNWLDGIVNEDGFMLNYDAETFVYFFSFDDIDIDVEYTAPSKRRFTNISI